MSQLLSIIIPAYNEGSTISQILDRVLATNLDGMDREVIIVNDGSTDDTKEILERYIGVKQGDFKIRLVNQDRNRGKGAAIRMGIEEASGDFLVIQDADMEYDPDNYVHLLQPILQSRADVVYGSRFMGSDPHRVLFFWHSLGNRFLTFLSNIFTNLNLTDMETCYKMFRAELIKNIYLRENRFGFEPEITAKISRIPGIRIYEVGISYYGRTYREGKKINWKDGFRAIYCIIKYNIFRRRVYR
jgi:glycosyltransferase involved in cell wall biosynthesis